MDLFESISANYSLAGRGVKRWYGRLPLLAKLIAWPWPLLAIPVLSVLSLLFKLGIVFDAMARWLERRRTRMIGALRRWETDLAYSAGAYFTVPILGTLLLPLVILLGVFPKFSTTSDFDTGDTQLDIDHGFFWQVGTGYLRIARSLLTNVARHGVLFLPIALLIALFTAPAAAVVGALMLVLIVLDWLGWLIDRIRGWVVTSSGQLARRAGDGLFGSVAMPLLLTLLFPVYILLLLIPKVASYDSSS